MQEKRACLESWYRDAVRSLWTYFFPFVLSFSWSSSGEKQCPRGIGHILWKISDLCIGSFCINLYFTWTLKPVEEVPRAVQPGASQTSAVCCSILFWSSFKEADAGMDVRLCPLDLSWNSLKKASLHLYVFRFCTLAITFVEKKKNKCCCALQPSKKSCKCLRVGSKIMLLINVGVLGLSGGIYWSRTSQAESDQCFHISQQTAFWLHPPWAREPGCCWCMVMLECAVRQYYCRAGDQPHCSF